MKVYHEQFGTGQIISSTEKLDESGSIVSADVMFEHGIELEMPLFEVTYSAKKAAAGEDIGKPGKEFKKIAAKAAAKYGSKAAGGRVAGAVLKKLRSEETDLDEATKGQVKVNAADARIKKKIQKEKVGTDDRNSNLQWPIHRVKSKSYDEDDTPVTMHHYVRAADKHRAVAKVQLDLTKKGHQVGNVKHMGMMKEETEELDEKLIGKQHKIDANKNGKIDAEDFKKLRKEESECDDDKKEKKGKKSKTDYEDVAKDSDDMSESTKVVTPATAAQRIPAVENTVREIMSQNRNLRQEAKIAEFKSRSE